MSDRLAFVERVLARTTRVMSGIGAIAVLLMMMFNIADITFRAFLRSSLRGTHEIVDFMMILVVFLAIPYVQHKKTNISISLLTDRFPRKTKAITESVMCILSLAIIGTMTWAAFGHFRRLWETGKDTEVLNLPVAPFQFILAFGLLVLCIVIISELLHTVSGRVR
jgi:TRAP-type transport system small permease protein